MACGPPVARHRRDVGVVPQHALHGPRDSSFAPEDDDLFGSQPLNLLHGGRWDLIRVGQQDRRKECACQTCATREHPAGWTGGQQYSVGMSQPSCDSATAVS